MQTIHAKEDFVNSNTQQTLHDVKKTSPQSSQDRGTVSSQVKVSSVKKQIMDEQVPTNHQEKRSSSQIARSPSSSSPFCSLCKKYYKTHAGLYKHRRTQHPDLIKSIKPIVCREPNCDFRCKTKMMSISYQRNVSATVHINVN